MPKSQPNHSRNSKLRRTCKLCRKKVVGRSDKIFCSIHCKNEYHLRLRRNTAKVAKTIDRILHRNRSILLELMGFKTGPVKVDRLYLDKKNFKFDFYTGCRISSKEWHIHYVYDFAWLKEPDQKVSVYRLNQIENQ